MLMPRVLDVVRFGEFELDLRAYALRRNGQPVRLERRPMDLLIFLVERRGELVTRTDIVDQLWGKDVFIEVEPAVNTAIKKIRRALDDSTTAPTFIETVPGKGYRFVAAVMDENPAPPATTVAATPAPEAVDPGGAPSPTVARKPGWWIALALLVGLAVPTWLWWPTSVASRSGPMRLVPLTTLTGMERGSAFSPDGKQIAFTWSGEAQDNWDIYVKLIGSSDAMRLTTDGDRDLAPRWSYDGRFIAYLRQEPSGEVEYVRIMSALGGGDHQISNLNVLPTISWSPDGRWIAVGVVTTPETPGGIYLLPVAGGNPRRLTPALTGGEDWMAAVSPDGSQLAYGSCTEFTSNCYVQVLTLDRALEPVGPPRRLSRTPAQTLRGITWTRDGSSIVWGAIDGPVHELMRSDASGQTAAERIEIAGTGALFPLADPSSDRLSFTKEVIDQDVYALANRASRPVARSSVLDAAGQMSPDGHRIAFCSDRNGEATDIWVADTDGTNVGQISHGPGRYQCSPVWSPDGRAIAFEARDSTGDSEIYVADVALRQSRRITEGRGNRTSPTWSRDGKSIYFSWDSGAGRDIWRVSANGGMPQRVTTTRSGLSGAESIDGGTFFYLGYRAPRLHEPTDAPLLAVPIAGGSPRTVVECVRGTAYSVGDHGIYYVPCATTLADLRDPPVVLLDLATGKSHAIGILEQYQNNVPSGFFASRDGRVVLYDRVVTRGEDLMLIENFR